MQIYIDTCVLPRCRLEEGRAYLRDPGENIGFECLPMFDLADFEANLEKNLPLFCESPLVFHEPVWGVEHTAPKGSPEYEEGMYHIRLTRKYAGMLHPTDLVYHFNNCVIPQGEKEDRLRISLENLEEMKEMFPGVRVLVENTGIQRLGTQLLNEEAFADLAESRNLDVLIDVGHANANGWDVFRLISRRGSRIRGFHLHNNDGKDDLHNRLRDGTLDMDALIPFITREVPDAFLVIEYTRPEYHGDPLKNDIRYLADLLAKGA